MQDVDGLREGLAERGKNELRHALSLVKRGLVRAFSWNEIKKHDRLYTLGLAAITADIAVPLTGPATITVANLPGLNTILPSDELQLLNAFFANIYVSGPVLYGMAVSIEFGMWTVGIKAAAKAYHAVEKLYPHLRDTFENEKRLYPALSSTYRKAIGVLENDERLYPQIKERIAHFSAVREIRRETKLARRVAIA